MLSSVVTARSAHVPGEISFHKEQWTGRENSETGFVFIAFSIAEHCRLRKNIFFSLPDEGFKCLAVEGWRYAGIYKLAWDMRKSESYFLSILLAT